MTDLLLYNILRTTAGRFSLTGAVIAILIALGLGLLEAAVYSYRSVYTKSFLITLSLLPAIVAAVIMLVNGNLGAGVAVAGTFSLVRFRSVPGTAKEIGAIFLAMATGLACGMGYPDFSVIFAAILCGMTLLLNATSFGENKAGVKRKFLTVTVPEDLEYGGIFDDIFERYTNTARLIGVRTTNLGSLNKLTYEVTLKELGSEKQMIDEIRERNGNLEVGLTIMPQVPTEL